MTYIVGAIIFRTTLAAITLDKSINDGSVIITFSVNLQFVVVVAKVNNRFYVNTAKITINNLEKINFVGTVASIKF